MMKKICILIAIAAPIPASSAEDAYVPAAAGTGNAGVESYQEAYAEKKGLDAPVDDNDSELLDGMISISLSDPKDINWQGVLDASDAAAAPGNQVILPFLQSYPIDNLEIKFKLWRQRF
ncbi:MAG: hypothetical protein LBK26_01285 [Rickettsiales bacterium]|jgi:hypothetical protein|nr:hypothetical protein [Rickettsiales bacterium]